jgi:hypothetical protein
LVEGLLPLERAKALLPERGLLPLVVSVLWG